ncbi:MAG: lipoyl(octanoyl) transferase LipB [Candidatus Binatia bacterium]
MAEIIVVYRLGITNYEDAWRLQQTMHRRCQTSGENILLLTEHFPVVTLGYRRPYHQLRVPVDELRKKGVALFEVERGGGATYHGPGQLVAYPIFSSLFRYLGVRRFISSLEEVMYRVCARYDVPTVRKSGYPGLWVDTRKIGTVGIAVRRGTALHGLALNVNIEMSAFSDIVPCGLEGCRVTSLTEAVGRECTMAETVEFLIEAFNGVFAAPIEERYDVGCSVEREALTGPVAHH